MKVITVTNQKGGVAKTTTTASFGYELAEFGNRVLLIDLDPQCNLSQYLNVSDESDDKSMYNVLCGKAKISDVIKSSENVDIVASDLLLAGAEQEMNKPGREYKLKESLSEIKDRYDYILVDTPPNLGILTVNALTAADEVLIPSNAGAFSTRAFLQLFETIAGVKKYFNPSLLVNGILITRYNQNTKISKANREIISQLADRLGCSLYDTNIRTSIVVEEAQYEQVVISKYNRNCTVSQDYHDFVIEFLDKEKK